MYWSILLLSVLTFTDPTVNEVTGEVIETRLLLESEEPTHTTELSEVSQSTAHHGTKTENRQDNKHAESLDVLPFMQRHQIHPYFYPATWPKYIYRASPYQPVFPYLMTIFKSSPPTYKPSNEEMFMARNPFPVDDELSEEETIQEMEAIKKELEESVSIRRQHDARLLDLLPSISISPDNASVTVSMKSFVSLLRSLNSRITLTLTTRTILLPSISIKNSEFKS